MSTRTRKPRPDGLRKAGISAHRCTQRIIETYRAADADTVARGLSWYGDALDVAITMTELDDTLTLDAAAAVIASYSPQLPWVANKRAALTFARNGSKETGVLGESHERAQWVCGQLDPVAALNTFRATSKAFKIESFARNILGDTDAVTIDVWAVRVALGANRNDGEKLLKRVGVYRDLADCYRKAAAELGVPASAVQAVTWCQIRGKAD